MLTMREAYYKPIASEIDLLLGPLYFILILLLFLFIRNQLYPEDKLLRKYFIQGLTLKIFGGIGVGLVYYFYYGGGDTNEFYNNATVMYSAFQNNVNDFFILLFNGNEPNLPLSEDYMSWMYFRRDDSSYTIGKIAGVFAMFTFDTYFPIAICFAALSFTGVWALFITLCDSYPQLRKQFAIAILFIPSVFFWGSGVMKDSITIACVGWITWSSYNLFIKKQKMVASMIMLFFSVYFCLSIKPYIILSFAPALVFWIFLTYRDKVKLQFMRALMGPVVIVVSSVAGFFVIRKLGADFQQYSFQNALKTASNFQAWHGFLAANASASGYSLGAMDGSFGSVLKNIPAAINVTLFRPYIWETRNPVMLLSAVESLVLMVFTIRIFWRTGIMRTLQAIFNNATIFFCLFFTMFFGFCVGFTAYNFGALVRYKIPCIPFFVAGLFILNYVTEQDRVKRLGEKRRF